MSKASTNDWFKDAQEPFSDIAYVLTELDKRKLIPDDMRQAILKHARNSIGTLPLTMAAVASSLAAAVSGDIGLDKRQVEGVSWGIAALAEQAHGWNALADCFET